MNKKRILCLWLVFMSFSFLLFAAPSAPATNKKISPAPWENKSDTTINPNKSVTGTAPNPVAEGNRLPRQEVTVHAGPCSDFEFQGDAIQAVRRSSGYECPPGYSCDDFNHGMGIGKCAWEGNSELYAENPSCRWEHCANY